ncbi:MAG: hypothetical protein H0U49_03595 [Parachlamydiaceae bacterium]|nr:hypothetical protein [Parachlamydiaceae bacterium]
MNTSPCNNSSRGSRSITTTIEEEQNTRIVLPLTKNGFESKNKQNENISSISSSAITPNCLNNSSTGTKKPIKLEKKIMDLSKSSPEFKFEKNSEINALQNKDSEKTECLLSSIREKREDVQKKISICVNKTQFMNSSGLSTSSVSHGCLSNSGSTTHSPIKIELKEPFILNLEETESSESSTEYKNEINNENLNSLKKEDQILQEIEEYFEEDIETKDHLGALNSLFTMASDFAHHNGTTVFSALTTLGTGLTSAASGGYLQPVIGAVAVAVSMNEAFKMYKNYINDRGASDHLKIIKNTFESLAKKNELAKKTINEAIETQNQIKEELNSSIAMINFLNNQLANTTQEFHANINNGLALQINIKNDLESQYEALSNALNSSNKACDVLRKQIKLLTIFQTDMSKIEDSNLSRDEIENLVREIKAKINEIICLSSDAQDHQIEATRHMNSALNVRGSVVKLNDHFVEIWTKLQIIEKKYNEIIEFNKHTENKLKETEDKVNEQGAKIHLLEDIVEELDVKTKLGHKSAVAEIQNEDFGTESMRVGTVGALITGVGVGFVTFGPLGACGGLVAGYYSTTPAAKMAHLARKTLRATVETDLDEEFKICKAKLQNLPKGHKNTTISIKGKFGPSSAKIAGALIRPFGTAGTNLIADVNNIVIDYPVVSTIISWTPVRHLFSPTRLEKVSSHIGGFINCTFAGIDLPEIKFTVLDNPDFSTYGAISSKSQQDLSALLESLLDDDAIQPEMILEFLKKLENVNVSTINNERKPVIKSICMITETSLAMKILKRDCLRKIKKGNEKKLLKQNIILEEGKIQDEADICDGKKVIFEFKK